MTTATSITLFLTLISLVAAAPQPGDADFPTRNGNPRHEQKVAVIKNGNFDLVLIGDSITHEIGELDGKYKPNRAVWDRHFAPRHAINLGMNGQRTEEILWNLQNGELEFAKSPKVVMLLIGTNNADDRHFKNVHTPEQILAGTKAIVEEIHKRHPTTKILVLRIFPRGGDAEKSASPPAFNSSATCIETCRRAGQLTAQLADGKQVFWLDLNHVFLRPDGSINTGLMWDLLHPSPLGTEAWVQAAEPLLAQLMGDKPILDPSLLPAAPAPAPKPHATDDGLALTPPMGWYPWNIFGQEPQNEKLIRETVAALVASGMKEAGYSYVGPDEGICFSRADDGKLTSNLKRYPSGMRGLGDAIHRQGLKYALYTDAGVRTCSGDMPGTKDHEYVDMQAFAEWRADYVKIDWCNTQGQDIVRTYTELHDAQHAAGRPIVHSLCSWGDGEPWKWAAPIGHLWRTASDICAPGKADWELAMKLTAINEKLHAYAGPGHWNDPDMLITGMPGLSEVQNRSFFSLWCMMAAPLIAGNDLRAMTAETIRILTNPEAIAVNQDPLGVQGHISRTAGKVEIWAGKPLFDGSRALLLFNRGTTTETVDIKLAELDLEREPGLFVRDLWKHVTTQPTLDPGGVMSFQVEPNDVGFFRISNTNDFPLPPVIVADTYLISLRANGTARQELAGSLNLTNRGSAELPLWKVHQKLPGWLTVTVTKSGKTQTVVNSVATTSLNKGAYHAVVRLDNTEPVSGKPMSAVYYDVDLEVVD